VNEPDYLGKAIHFWNPHWASGDLFLKTADSQVVFCFAVGWLAWFVSATVLAWSVRLVTWGLLAWAWRRLSVAVVPRPWFSLLTAVIFLALVQRATMAGEWVVGGAEGKGLAYVLVLLGLESLVRGRWNRTWLLLGAASAFHVIAGGWAAVAAGLAWLGEVARPTAAAEGWSRPPTLWAMAPALLGGLALALPGLIPALLLDRGAAPAVVRQAHEIYVYQRLPHHLDPLRFPLDRVASMAALSAVWLFAAWKLEDAGLRRLGRFVHAALAIALVGIAIRLLGIWNEGLAADLLRFYWFRLADVAVPLGVALVVIRRLTASPARRPVRYFRVALVALAVFQVADCVVLRLFSDAPAAPDRVPDAAAWRAAYHWLTLRPERPLFPRRPRADRLADTPSWLSACAWVAESGRIPPSSLFITPRLSQTFKWYAGRGEVAVLKDLPQDARSIVAWWARIQDLYATGKEPPQDRYYDSLADRGAEPLRRLAAKYQADYLLTQVTDPLLKLPIVYQNRGYVIYEFGGHKTPEE
jgi:hypothetical protein